MVAFKIDVEIYSYKLHLLIITGVIPGVGAIIGYTHSSNHSYRVHKSEAVRKYDGSPTSGNCFMEIGQLRSVHDFTNSDAVSD
jgi:hypothetical protein